MHWPPRWPPPLRLPAFAGYTVKMGARVNQEIGWSFTGKEQTVNGKDDVTDSFVNLVGNSYLRAKFMSDDKKVGAMIEIGMKEGSNIGTRHAYAWYRLGRCTFLAGQTEQLAGRQGPLLDLAETVRRAQRRRRAGLGQGLGSPPAKGPVDLAQRDVWFSGRPGKTAFHAGGRHKHLRVGRAQHVALGELRL